MIASQARLKSKLTEKGATLPSATMRRKQVSGSTEASELPRLRDYAPGTDRMAFWQRDVRKAASGVSKGKRAQGTSNEHDRHMWALNEYAKRQGFDSFVERVQEGEHPEATSSTGMLKPTYDESRVGRDASGAARADRVVPAGHGLGKQRGAEGRPQRRHAVGDGRAAMLRRSGPGSAPGGQEVGAAQGCSCAPRTRSRREILRRRAKF